MKEEFITSVTIEKLWVFFLIECFSLSSIKGIIFELMYVQPIDNMHMLMQSQ